MQESIRCYCYSVIDSSILGGGKVSNLTQYKKLEMPLSTEKYNISTFNKNSQVIDNELHRLEMKDQELESKSQELESKNQALDFKNQEQDEKFDEQTALINAHTSNNNNPHSVTKSQIGLSNVDNTADMDKPVSERQQAAITEASNNIMARINDIVVKDAELQGSIQTETNRATQSEQELRDSIDKIKTYTHPTGAGYEHIPAGGSAGQILRWLSNGKAQWSNEDSSGGGSFIFKQSSKDCNVSGTLSNDNISLILDKTIQSPQKVIIDSIILNVTDVTFKSAPIGSGSLTEKKGTAISSICVPYIYNNSNPITCLYGTYNNKDLFIMLLCIGGAVSTEGFYVYMQTTQPYVIIFNSSDGTFSIEQAINCKLTVSNSYYTYFM